MKSQTIGDILAMLAVLMFIVLGLSVEAKAADLSLQVPFYAQHFKGEGWNQHNYGIGIRADFDHDISVEAGTFHNSVYKQSEYAYVAWQPIKIEIGDFDLRVGAAVGAINGYPGYHSGSFGPAAAGVISLEHKSGYALDMLVIPNTKAASGCVGFVGRIPL